MLTATMNVSGISVIRLAGACSCIADSPCPVVVVRRGSGLKSAPLAIDRIRRYRSAEHKPALARLEDAHAQHYCRRLGGCGHPRRPDRANGAPPLARGEPHWVRLVLWPLVGMAGFEAVPNAAMSANAYCRIEEMGL
jgi:hypothetical protein